MRRKIHIDDLSLVQVERRLQRIKNPKEKIDVLLQYGKSIFAKDVNTSFQFLEKAFQLSENVEYDFGLMKSAEYLAEYYNNVLGNLIEAEKYNAIAEQYAIKLNNKSSLSIALRTKGSILETRANYTEAESLIVRALEMQQELGDDELSSVTLTELGYLYWKRGLYKKSRENFNNALVYFEKTQNVVKQAGVIHNIGVLFSEEGDYAQAILQLEKSIALKERINDTHGLSVSYHTLGTQYVHIQDLEKALQYFETSLQLKRQIKSERVFLTIGNMAYVYSVLEQYDLAIEYYNQAYTLAWNSGDKRNAADYKLYISTVLSKQGKVEESEATLESIKDLVEEIADPVAIVNLLQNLAGVAKRKKEYAYSIELLLRANVISATIENNYTLIQNLFGLSDVYLESGDTTNAIQYAKMCLDVIQTSNEKTRLADVLQVLAESYAELGNYADAYEYQKNASATNIEQLKVNFTHKNNTLLVQFDVERTKKEAELQRMKAEQLEKELEMKKNELTALALHLVNKNEFLSELQEQIGENIEDTNEVLKSIAAKIASTEKDETDWRRFEDQFMQVNPGFSKKLMQASSNTLTKTEVKICQLLKTGLSTKEIANILFLSKRTVDTHRHNIHKKLKLQDVSLISWLLSL